MGRGRGERGGERERNLVVIISWSVIDFRCNMHMPALFSYSR